MPAKKKSKHAKSPPTATTKKKTKRAKSRRPPPGELHHLLTETQSYAEPRALNTQRRSPYHKDLLRRPERARLEAPGAHVGHDRPEDGVNRSNGLNLMHTTLYYGESSEDYGQVEETRGAGGQGGASAHDQRFDLLHRRRRTPNIRAVANVPNGQGSSA